MLGKVPRTLRSQNKAPATHATDSNNEQEAMDAAVTVAAEFVGDCRDLCTFFAASKPLRDAKHSASLAVRLVEQRRRRW